MCIKICVHIVCHLRNKLLRMSGLQQRIERATETADKHQNYDELKIQPSWHRAREHGWFNIEGKIILSITNNTEVSMARGM